MIISSTMARAITIIMMATMATSSDPRGCHLQMICAAARRGVAKELLDPLRGLRELKRAFMLAPSAPCSSLARQCPHTDKELVQELSSFPSAFTSSHSSSNQLHSRPKRGAKIHKFYAHEAYNYNGQETHPREVVPQPRKRRRLRVPRRRQLRRPPKRQGGGGMPPIFTPEGSSARSVCRTCDRRKTVCTVYSIGSWAGCTGAWLMAGVPGQIVCNVATAPGSFGCTMNTLHCYMESCGLVSLPRLP